MKGIGRNAVIYTFHLLLRLLLSPLRPGFSSRSLVVVPLSLDPFIWLSTDAPLSGSKIKKRESIYFINSLSKKPVVPKGCSF